MSPPTRLYVWVPAPVGLADNLLNRMQGMRRG